MAQTTTRTYHYSGSRIDYAKRSRRDHVVTKANTGIAQMAGTMTVIVLAFCLVAYAAQAVTAPLADAINPTPVVAVASR